MDLTIITSALSSIKVSVDIAKLLKDSDVSFEKAEIKLKLAGLIGSLAETKMQIADINELLLTKEAENKKLQEELNLKENIQYEQPYYWVLIDDKKDGPYCQQCYDKDTKLIRLQNDSIGEWRCFSCKEYYRDKMYEEYEE